MGLRGKRAAGGGGRVTRLAIAAWMQLVAAALIAALIFCLVRAVTDLRARRFSWAAASLILSAVLLAAVLTPVRTHAVKVALTPQLIN